MHGVQGVRPLGFGPGVLREGSALPARRKGSPHGPSHRGAPPVRPLSRMAAVFPRSPSDKIQCAGLAPQLLTVLPHSSRDDGHHENDLQQIGAPHTVYCLGGVGAGCRPHVPPVGGQQGGR